jgi:hypothetical protein
VLLSLSEEVFGVGHYSGLNKMGTVLDKALLNKPKEKYWITYILQRIRKNKNFLGFISGPTGSGKSYSTLSICEALDPEFNIDRCVFGGIELMNLINSGKLKRGSCIAFEEVGVEMSNKNWQSVANKMLNYLMQTFRHKNFILIMNSPFMDFVDKSTRKLFHAEMETKGIDLTTNEVYLKPQLLQYNARLQKFYYKRLKVITAQGKVPVDIWKVAKPSKELLREYEKKKSEYTQKLNQKILNELERAEGKGKKTDLTEIQTEVLGMLKEGLTVDQIAKLRDRVPRVIRDNILGIKKKGYKLKAIYKDGILVRYEVISPNKEDSTEI